MTEVGLFQFRRHMVMVIWEMWLLTMCMYTRLLGNHHSKFVFSDFLPPCLISLNNLDSYVYVNAVSGSVGWHSPLVWLGWHHSISRAWIFNSPIIANHAFHPFDTSQRLSLSGDWWWQHVLLRCCFLLSKRQCKDKKPTSVNRNRFCSNRRSLICIQSASALTSLIAQSWIRHQPKKKIVPTLCAPAQCTRTLLQP